ncbi:MAG: hypothetical protein K9M56_00690 [Victivallales bacterium]|nr:hypothetical protein [Victivallales bacterium]
MVNALVKGRYTTEIKPVLKKYNIKTVDKNPDIIITYGGDGTLLEAEREYPDLPKLPIRDTRTAPLCKKHSIENTIKAFTRGELEKHEILRLKGKSKTTKDELYGINDIFIHNIKRNSAIRFKVKINSKQYLNEIASDCIGFATPHGSTGYFQSITHCIFRQGIGIAMGNSREHINHIIVTENSKIEIEILRGTAIMIADNNPKAVNLEEGSKLIIASAGKKAVVYGLEIFMCNQCRKLRHLKI